MIRLFSIAFVLSLLSTACGQSDFDTLAKAYASEKVELAQPEDVSDSTLVLDSRELPEYVVSHIEGALHIGYDDFDLAVLDSVDLNQPIIIYCSVGYRSGKIGEKLIEHGYTDVRNLYGGLFNWVNTGHSVVNHEGPTQKIHTYNKRWSQWVTKGEKTW